MTERAGDVEGPVGVDRLQPAAEIQALGLDRDSDLAKFLTNVFGEPYPVLAIGQEVLCHLEANAVGSPLVAGLVEQRVRLGRAVSVGFEGLVEERRIGAHDRTNARRSLAIPDDVDDLLPVEDRADCLTNLLIGEW